MNRRSFMRQSAIVPIAVQLWPNLAFSQPDAGHYEWLARKFCEDKYAVGRPTKTFRSVTGEPYVVLQVEGPEATPFEKPEGRPFSDFYGGKTPEDALASFRTAFSGYTQGKEASKHTLYWREIPELSCQINISGGRCHEWYQFYARLLVSDKPALT